MAGKTRNSVLKETIDKYLNSIDADTSPEVIEEELLYRIEVEFSMQHNCIAESKSYYWQIPKVLPLVAIKDIILKRENVKRIKPIEEEDTYELMCYQEEGKYKGLYTADRAELERLVTKYHRSASKRDRQEVLSFLEMEAPLCSVTTDPNLVPVNNGIFNHEKKQLMPFSPDYVFLCKFAVDYVACPKRPVMQNPDGTFWDVDSWIKELSDDPEIQELLWEIIAACVHPNTPHNKVVCPYSHKGNNGKGTFLELIRNLCGRENVANISFYAFSKDFMLEDLPNSLAVAVDENPVDTFTKMTDLVKTVITGDTVKINRKHKKAISYRFRGLMIQCLNELPLFADRTGAFYRRFLLVPFDKCFTGCERPYIKQKYLADREVLEYVLHKALHMDFRGFSNPVACQILLEKFKSDNDPIRDFLATMLEKTVWNMLPNDFLYALYKEWLKETYPGRHALGKTTFLNRMREIIWEPNSAYAGRWEVRITQVTLDASEPEYLIEEYNLTKWMNPFCTNRDRDRLCLAPQNGGKFRGLLRLTPKSC